jgi:signal transduction histidine kinase
MKTTILLVDDNATDRLILRSILEHYGCEVLEAADGKEGLDHALQHAPDLILSDALMPVMDGYQFLKALKEDERVRAVPFVFYTAVYTGGRENQLALSLGAEAFLVKPLSAPLLWEKISGIIHSRVATQAVQQPETAMPEDSFLKQYSAVVASKLEEKVRDLEREIAERRSAEETVGRQHEELRALSARLAAAEEQERRRIARELHDQVGQNLTALGISLSILRAQLPAAGAGSLLTRIDDSLKLLEETTVRVRELMTELRPPVLDDYGLAAAVEWYAKEFGDRANLVVEVTASDALPRMDPAREITMFRILQEALTNVAKHASASRVQVRLVNAGGLVRMTVRDDGSGFDPAVQSRSQRPTWGLLNMAERARMMNGICTVKSAPGQGTVVVVEGAL